MPTENIDGRGGPYRHQQPPPTGAPRAPPPPPPPRPPAPARGALPARPDAARQARRELLTRGLDEDISHTVTLLTTELIANAIRHAGMDPAHDRIVFFGRLAPDPVRIEVAGSGPEFRPAWRIALAMSS